MPLSRGLPDPAQQAGDALGKAHLMMLVPVALIAGYALAGHLGLTTASVGALTIVSLLYAFRGRSTPMPTPGRRVLLDRPAIVAEAEQRLASSLYCLGVFGLEIDGYRSLSERFEHGRLSALLGQVEERIQSTLRREELAARLDGPSFIVLSGPAAALDLTTGLQIASRLQSAVAEPYDLDGTTVCLTASVGFSLSNRIAAPTVEGLFLAATTALVEAQRSGPSAIRSYSATMQRRIEARRFLADDVAIALREGQISAYFQPQISTLTGEITGFETLARWHHPRRGPVPPSEFLPAFKDAGAMMQLGELMLRQALSALRHWQDAGVTVPRIGINLSTTELSDPGLVPLIRQNLSEFGFGPQRLAIEVLETVVANKVRGVVVDNLAQLAEMGCGIDLDDFGTGHASITSIRRFSIERIKIDRSFVTGIDEDPEQQDMVAAILTMADRLGLDALAEGVETHSEEATLARLGCTHIQGFGVAHPLPLNETLPWVEAYNARRQSRGAIALDRRAV